MIKKNGILLPLTLLGVLALVIVKIDAITDFTVKLISSTPEVVIDPANEYASNNNFNYVEKNNSFVPYSKQDLLNIFYSILDNGYDTFTFYCPSEYTECLNDVESITNNQITITNIGNFVHPYNNFTNLKVVTDSLGEVDVIVTKLYSDDMILEINNKIDEIFSRIFTNEMDLYDKILAAHDYIIDNAFYDTSDLKNSGNAYGTLIDGKSKCAGYADSMAIILTKLGVKNFKVASEAHVWNAAYIDNEWTNIDLTWDDPIVSNGTNITDTIRHKFYMVDTSTLQTYDTEEHNFDKSVYSEVNN